VAHESKVLNHRTRKPFKTGARPTPRHKLAAAMPFVPTRPLLAAPPRPIVVPSFLEMWKNDVDGICVTAEECAALAFYSCMLGLPEIKISDTTELAFASKYDVVNGADLTQVMDEMASDGFHQAGVTYKDGPYTSVDFANETILQAAIEQGPIKIGIDADALPQTAGNANGWYASGGSPGQFSSEDHCVGLWNHGDSAALFAALGAKMPSGFPATGYHLFTWSTVGVVDHAWIMSTVGEAWLRTPTSIGLGPVTPPPPGPIVPPAPLFSVQVRNAIRAGGTLAVRSVPVAIPSGKYDFVPSAGSAAAACDAD
jgi:hypothetical protein